MLILTLSLWFVNPPSPHFFIALNNKHYSIREAGSLGLSRHHKLDLFIMRESVIGSPESQLRCRMLLTNKTCTWCDGPLHCKHFVYGEDSGRGICDSCGRAHWGLAGKICPKCHGIGYVLD